MYERVRIAQALSDLREHHTATSEAWDNLSQDVPYQRGTYVRTVRTISAVSTVRNNYLDVDVADKGWLLII